jgi:DNA-binding MarR family transcriptional regulator
MAMPRRNPGFDLEAFLPYRLAVVSAQVSREFAELYRRKFGISVPEWRILAHLSQTDSVSVRDIHERVDMDKSKVSRAAARLEKSGLVEKLVNPDDRRLVMLYLSTKGRSLMARIEPVALEFQKQLFDRLGNSAASLERAIDLLTQKRR